MVAREGDFSGIAGKLVSPAEEAVPGEIKAAFGVPLAMPTAAD
jgi:hypothetical protein